MVNVAPQKTLENIYIFYVQEELVNIHMCHPGGIAGAASRITGAMAKGVAAITMDEEYQQKRREAMNKQPSGLREGLTRGGKGLVSVCTTLSVCTVCPCVLFQHMVISTKHTFDRGYAETVKLVTIILQTVNWEFGYNVLFTVFFSGICQWDHRDCYQTY